MLLNGVGAMSCNNNSVLQGPSALNVVDGGCVDVGVKQGQAVYTPLTLKYYDFAVHVISNKFLWKCPTRRIEEYYERSLSANHLDVGVGTGYFLDRCRFPVNDPSVVLMDLNPSTLAFVSQRIARYAPQCHSCNVLEPISFDRKFDSIGMNYLLHCLPGSLSSKAIVFDHLKSLMNPGAVLFGSTLLQGGVPRNILARGLMALYNRKGIFSNGDDDLDTLRYELCQRFQKVTIEVRGCAALFSCKVS